MIRQPVKIGSLTASSGAVLDLSVPVGHNGTITGFTFHCVSNASTLAASTVAQIKTAISKINLSVTHKTEGTFAILNDVSPTFLFARELYYAQSRGLAANVDGILHYDPSAAMRGGEAASNIRNLGTRDLTDMVIRVTFGGTITGVVRVDVYAEIDYNLIADLGAHVRIAKASESVGVAGGEVEVRGLPRIDSRFGYEAIHVHSASLTDMTISKVSMVIDGSNWLYRDIQKEIIDRALILQNRKPQDGFTTLDFAKEDNPAYFLNGGMSEIKLLPTFVAGGSAAAGSVAVWYETLRKA